ncbi:hypothetical protein [Streptomyces sindenensis]|uniref:hypothetical protein n=1 Tax=Streptomyces sindenensis TaxID=67363 RepID=UPI00167224E3|nr:hypothetical protein GCM10010231_38140 [Streptomyces sindenensis]
MSGRTDSKRFRVRRDSIPAARRHVRAVLLGWKLGGLVDDETSGRGLLIVGALAEQWGVRPRNPGKTVWAHLSVGAGQR